MHLKGELGWRRKGYKEGYSSLSAAASFDIARTERDLSVCRGVPGTLPGSFLRANRCNDS